ncbi:PPK2 family polyphosphate:nucleotide phosphotransferase [Motilibacter rhizosphaerae]|uniref:PPK2 family polyphosphate:nucleotide phosphotransferase n=1 Tax=Motilibacter rhizosphaerae TaxID=598652 RepID=A0A4Q7NQX8_9ACTN|nr:PPK2 family polyphosphate kinase [Motilibacter rhizosphaerae]RZS89463.1 PPK2 family polyphosphate:nucleotide phosphotransferase [Motilibacter rhizosphaerae]
MGKHRRPASPHQLSDLLRLDPGAPVDLTRIDPGSTPGSDEGKKRAREVQAGLAPRFADLQERLYAQGRSGGPRRVLLVLQGMDTSGKGGVSRHVLGQVDPQGVTIAAFGAPTEEELAHDFLWRIERELPAAGQIGVFDRSHYEDIVSVRVRGLAPQEVWEARYDRINDWERQLVEDGTTVVKVFLHISRAESKERLLARLDDPTKHWKYKAKDVDDRALWPAWQQAYADVLQRCGTDVAPWFVVPADHKWYRDLAVTSLLVEQLERFGLGWPAADVDVAAERARLLAAE